MARFGTWGRLAVLAAPIACGCASDFDTSRNTPPRSTLGHELFSVVCDRVGAQALREDVTGTSFHAVCHPDTTGAYATRVDTTKLPDLSDTTNIDGRPVTRAELEANRVHNVARIEALARRRADFIAAIDAAIPDTQLTAATCGGAQVPLQRELSDTLGRLVELYDDDTIPNATRGFGDVLNAVKADPDAQAALARLDARRGYRPIGDALGLARPVLAYPHLVDVIHAVVTPLVSDDPHPPPAATSFESLRRALYEELRTSRADAPLAALTVASDAKQDGASVISRPRTLLEGMRTILRLEDAAFASGASAYIVARDERGYAAVPLVGGAVPPPFVDATGPNGVPDGLPDVDPLGQFVTQGAPLASPFFTPEAQDGTRDPAGRALGAGGAPVYGYVDTRRTFLAAMMRDVRPLFAPDPNRANEAMMNVLGALPALGGTRDLQPTTTRTYDPDPRALDRWKMGHSSTPPAGLGTTPVTLSYRAFHPETSPIADLVYAVGQIASHQEIDDLLLLARALLRDHPNDLASFVGLALDIKARADQHPEAGLPAASTFWDDMFHQLAIVAKEPALVEDVLRAVADPRTLPIEPSLATYLAMKDDISYDTNNLNGPSKNLTTGVAPPSFVTPVDRAQPDSGKNRSQMQQFLALLHDLNGLGICTKDGAIVHVNMNFQGLPISFDYPTNTTMSGLICGLVGSSAPSRLAKCQVFGYPNVMTLMTDVILGKAQLTVRDDCLNKLMNSPLATIAGGADAVLEQMSGVNGFSLHPSLRGFARLLYFNAPYPGLPTDTTPANAKTLAFLRDTIDPIPSMVCAPDPFTTPDGTMYALRKCADVGDTLRAREPNALFPVDELGFTASLRPLAGAFDAHHLPLLFASLWDVLHVHYGSTKQTKQECDPSLPRTDARWCAQSGLVSYEPLVVEILKSGVFARVQALLKTLASMQIPHCTARDAKGACTASTNVDGIHVVAEAMNLMFDASRSPGLVTRAGDALSLRNDGTRVDKVTPMALLVDAFKGIDGAFDAYAAANPGGPDRRALWKAARSRLVDTFLAVDGAGSSATFHDAAIVKALPAIVDVVRAQIGAHCPTRDGACAWAKKDLVDRTSAVISGPTFAAAIDLLDALVQDDGAREEIETLVTYLLDAMSGNDAQAGALAAVVDSLQVLDDDANLVPFYRVLSTALAAPVTDDARHVVRRGLVDAALRSVAKIYPPGACGAGRDPNGAIRAVLAGLVTPMGDRALTPLEVLADVIADVNRADPRSSAKLEGRDYGSISDEMSQFMLDPSRGLEQMYAIIKQATETP